MNFQIQAPWDDRGRSPATQLYQQARRHMDAGEHEQAIELFRQSAIQLPHHKTYELLGECLLRQKRFGEAVLFLAASTTLNPGVRAPSLLAEAWLELGDYLRALETATLALARDPNNRAALRIKEIAAKKAGR